MTTAPPTRFFRKSRYEEALIDGLSRGHSRRRPLTKPALWPVKTPGFKIGFKASTRGCFRVFHFFAA
ncbi:MAG: hypothetical protein ACREE6_07250, partial [Limisphaerales bacterium]